MLEAMTPEELFRYRVAYEVLPLDDGWKQTDTISGAFHDNFVRFEHGQAGKSSVPADRWHKPGDYIPKVTFASGVQLAVNDSAIDLHEKLIEERYGGGWDDWQFGRGGDG